MPGLTPGIHRRPCCLVLYLVFMWVLVDLYGNTWFPISLLVLMGTPVVWSHTEYYVSSYCPVSHFLLGEFLFGLTLGFYGSPCCLVSYRVLWSFLLSGFSLFIMRVHVRSHTWFLWWLMLSGLTPNIMAVLTVLFLTLNCGGSWSDLTPGFRGVPVVWSHTEFIWQFVLYDFSLLTMWVLVRSHTWF